MQPQSGGVLGARLHAGGGGANLNEDDMLVGGDGNDTIYARHGNDILMGG
ncbi:MAG: hypothetical protein HC838_17765, partial [Spirulinaceae cyanobacterium RM2_2_10]|nr:hypothetical protein [Spirulinaceae cyanobacterium RM2_2_10]